MALSIFLNTYTLWYWIIDRHILSLSSVSWCPNMTTPCCPRVSATLIR